MIDYQDSILWERYTADFGVNGEKKLTWPTLEGAGNREFYVTGNIKDTTWMVRKLIARNALRTQAINRDTSGFHYSWDWDGVHFVNLNLYGGGTELGYLGYRPMRALEFLAEDLAARVGTSGRPVFIMQHYPLRDNTYFPPAQRTLMSNVIRDYNVIGIVHGHSHAEAVYKWIVSGDTVDVFDDGTAQNGDMMVFQITDGRLRAISRTHTTWSTTVLLDKTISMGTPIPVRPGETRAYHDTYRDGLFVVAEGGPSLVLSGGVRRVEIIDLAGRHVASLPVRDGRAEWNRRDAAGKRVAAGLYGVREGGRRASIGKKLLR
jgi:cytolysin (calcineurin-like family phosphatase)